MQIEQQERRAEELHKALKLIRREGKTVFFKSPVTQSNWVLDTLSFVDEWSDVKTAKFYHYQPRKRLLWIKLPEGSLKNSRYRDNLQPIRLSEAVKMGMVLEKPE